MVNNSMTFQDKNHIFLKSEKGASQKCNNIQSVSLQ